MIGTKLAHYEITSHLGSGGMGDVYQATDSKLGRSVAIKLLPEAFRHDGDLAARFEREARLLAALNHSNIAAIYGIEQSGERKFLVMELVGGETLAERIKRGPIPIDDALGIAKQIADALESAHEKGIIHRDLKPANVKITPDGNVKVLDFGLAKAFESEASQANLTQSPTLSLAATNAGVILGTAAYMSPEQAKGKTVDKRGDIWAFGVVVYEMLAGRTMFSGETASETMAAVMKSEPDWNVLPANTPARLLDLLHRCLIKEPRNRLQAIGEARLVLSGPMEDPRPLIDRSMIGLTRKLAWGVAGLLMGALGALGFVHFREIAPMLPSLRFEISPPTVSGARYFALSPDGRHLAFIASDRGLPQLWVRALNSLESRALAGTDRATYPFWSPDGAYLGFFQQGKLKKIDAAGGPSQTLCDASSGQGGAWNREGMIVFSPGPTSELFQVSAAGGAAAPVTKLEGGAGSHRFPAFLPDGIHFLYNAGSDKPEFAGVFVSSLDGDEPARILPDATNAVYAPSVGKANGYLLFRRENTLMAMSFDASTLAKGELFLVAEQVTGQSFSVSENGMLIYQSGSGPTRQLSWVDRTGKTSTPLGAASKLGIYVELSPDGKRVVFNETNDSNVDLWIYDIDRDLKTRLTTDPYNDLNPVWSPDGARIVFESYRTGNGTTLYEKPANGVLPEQLLLPHEPGVFKFARDWSRDGRFIVFVQSAGTTNGYDLWVLPLFGDRQPFPYIATPFHESHAAFSPNGRWMAYTSNESGTHQVIVQPFPDPSGEKWQISAQGGLYPLWRRDGKELFYVAPDGWIVSVAVRTDGNFEVGESTRLFKTTLDSPALPIGYSHDVAADGQKFLISSTVANSAGPITVLLNWTAALTRK